MLRVENLGFAIDTTVILESVSITVGAGEIVAVLGPSGCGKTTLLRLIAGLEEPNAGEMSWEGSPLGQVPASKRGFGLMFQDYALFPHLNVAGNVGFGLEGRDDDRLEAALDTVSLGGFGNRRIDSLSGGEQQRVALARSLAPGPRLLMLDEPLGALDRSLRDELGSEVRRILNDQGMAAIYVTHDQDEAFTVADRIVLMRQGKIVQVDTGAEMRSRPATAWVAEFLGLGTLIEPGGKHPSFLGNQPALLPASAVSVTENGDLSATVAARVFRGGRYRYDLLTKDGWRLQALSESDHREGDVVSFSLDLDQIVSFTPRAV